LGKARTEANLALVPDDSTQSVRLRASVLPGTLRPNMLKKLATAAVAVIVSFVAFGVLAEILVRAFEGEWWVLYPRYETGVTYGEYKLRRLEPNVRFRHSSHDGSWEFVTNSRGFRDTHDYSYEKPAGLVRILALGDSHTQGYEVRQDHTYSELLERWLRHRGINAEVLNTGISGLGTAEELAIFENEGFKYRPDIVVLGFFANDYEDNLKSGLFGLDPSGKLIVLRKDHQPGVKLQDFVYSIPGIRWLGEHSHLYATVFNKLWLFFKLRMTRDRMLEYAVPKEGEGPTTQQVALAQALLERLHQACNAHGAKLVIVDIPTLDKDFVTPISSIRPSLRAEMPRMADAYLDFADYLRSYLGVVEIHVPHGHRHISEFTHFAIATAVGEVVMNDLHRAAPAASDPAAEAPSH
jgi:lysophospholipase L1-like esterase